ncbi:MAG: hypothetical protein WKF56_04025 [Candidatus Limnocylindrales bacterium]
MRIRDLGLLACSLALVACGVSKPPDSPSPAPQATPSPKISQATPAVEATPSESVKPKALTVKIVKRTRSVSQGDMASITIKTTKKAQCSIDIEYGTGPATASGLGTNEANGKGQITWKWQVDASTTPGTWPITIGCELGERQGSLETTFEVK